MLGKIGVGKRLVKHFQNLGYFEMFLTEKTQPRETAGIWNEYLEIAGIWDSKWRLTATTATRYEKLKTQMKDNDHKTTRETERKKEKERDEYAVIVTKHQKWHLLITEHLKFI